MLFCYCWFLLVARQRLDVLWFTNFCQFLHLSVCLYATLRTITQICLYQFSYNFNTIISIEGWKHPLDFLLILAFSFPSYGTLTIWIKTIFYIKHTYSSIPGLISYIIIGIDKGKLNLIFIRPQKKCPNWSGLDLCGRIQLR